MTFPEFVKDLIVDACDFLDYEFCVDEWRRSELWGSGHNINQWRAGMALAYSHRIFNIIVTPIDEWPEKDEYAQKVTQEFKAALK